MPGQEVVTYIHSTHSGGRNSVPVIIVLEGTLGHVSYL